MTEIPKEYLLLFNTITDTEQTLSRLRQQLLEAQQQAEDLFVETVDESPHIREKR